MRTSEVLRRVRVRLAKCKPGERSDLTGCEPAEDVVDDASPTNRAQSVINTVTDTTKLEGNKIQKALDSPGQSEADQGKIRTFKRTLKAYQDLLQSNPGSAALGSTLDSLADAMNRVADTATIKDMGSSFSKDMKQKAEFLKSTVRTVDDQARKTRGA